MSIIGQERTASPNAPRAGESELAYFQRVLREAEEAKTRRFLEWNREQFLWERS